MKTYGNPDPKTYIESRSSKDLTKWSQAMDTEFEIMEEKNDGKSSRKMIYQLEGLIIIENPIL
jgi:hypothetical protein